MRGSLLKRASISDVTSEFFDLIVIGGGITGAGVAQDAAARGLSVLLVEKGDFASGTSSKSTKLVHGGLRYLQNLQFGVTLESVRERQLLSRLAPHMVWRLPFVVPLYRGQRLHNLKLKAGLWVYDLMAGFRTGNTFHKTLGRDQVLDLCPGVRADGLVGGLEYSDCRTDDARHTLAVIKSACQYGAMVANYTEVVGLIEENERVQGVRLRRCEPGSNSQASQFKAYGRLVVNATGIWTTSITSMAGGPSDIKVVPAKGVHITISAERLPIEAAMILPHPTDKRFCFAVPWYGSVIVGTTDTSYDGDLDNITVEDADIDYILEAVRFNFPDAEIGQDDITGAYAGARPLIQSTTASGSTADLSRKHTLVESHPGLITIAGGKLTTYRPMAAETVDLAARLIAVQRQNERPNGRHVAVAESKTDAILLGGFAEGADIEQEIADLRIRALQEGLGEDTAAYLPTAYGAEAALVLAMCEVNETMRRRIVAGHPYINAQIVHAVLSECAITLDDVLSRRIRLTITDTRAALAAAEPVSKIMARFLRWTEDERQDQVQRFIEMHGGR